MTATLVAAGAPGGAQGGPPGGTPGGPAVSAPSSAPVRAAHQGTLDELGTPLVDVTFCVVDLETSGTSARSGAGITEIGAVKVRGGTVCGEFQTLVDPGVPLPPYITVLTGITAPMLRGAPPIAAALPAFLEFAAGSVLVAHNAPFDVGFLRAAAALLDYRFPSFDVVDTATLARRVLVRDEAPNCKLATLAALFHCRAQPEHRALADARATVGVLHGLLERLGNLGVHTLEELATYSSRVTAAQRRKRHLAEHVPAGPGVYLFVGPHERVLYVGRSRNLRARVRNYFTASETRSRMAEMVRLAERVDAIRCATDLEARVRELRLIAAHKPPYNRRSRFPERVSWLKLTVEPFPRLSVVSRVLDDGAGYLGPFGSRRLADRAAAAVLETFPLRQCKTRLPRRPHGTHCALAEMGRCLAPCEGEVPPDDYARITAAVRASFATDPGVVVTALRGRIARLAADQRFEEAAEHRDRLVAFVRAADRMQRLAAIGRCAELVAARRLDDGGYELHVIRHGRLAAAGVAARGVPPRPVAGALVAAAETVEPPAGPTSAAGAEETEHVLRWLTTPGVRLVSVHGEWSCPVRGAGCYVDLTEPPPFDELAG